MIAQYILGGVIILLSLILIGIGIYIICKGEINGVISIVLGIVFTLAGVVVITTKDSPTKQDVIDGKAYYQETQIIADNDTIKTYEIIWKQENF